MFSVIRNTAQPFRIPDPDKPNVSQTIWQTVSDLTDKRSIFERTTRPNIDWVSQSLTYSPLFSHDDEAVHSYCFCHFRRRPRAFSEEYRRGEQEEQRTDEGADIGHVGIKGISVTKYE